MEKQLILVAISAAALAVSADSQAMFRRVPMRGASLQFQRVPVRSNSALSGKVKKVFKPSMQEWNNVVHEGSLVRRIAERIKPTTEFQLNNQLRKVKEIKFPLAYCSESRITREMLINHQKHDELCKKWLNAKKEVTWKNLESKAALAALLYGIGSLPASFELVLQGAKYHPELFALVGVSYYLPTLRLKIAKQEKKKLEDELAELANEHKRALRLSDDIQ